MPAAFKTQRCWRSYKNTQHLPYILNRNQPDASTDYTLCVASAETIASTAEQKCDVHKKRKKDWSIYRAALSAKVTGWFNTLRLVCYSPFLHIVAVVVIWKQCWEAFFSVLSLLSDTIFIVQQPHRKHRCPRVLGTWLLIFCVCVCVNQHPPLTHTSKLDAHAPPLYTLQIRK